MKKITPAHWRLLVITIMVGLIAAGLVIMLLRASCPKKEYEPLLLCDKPVQQAQITKVVCLDDAYL